MVKTIERIYLKGPFGDETSLYEIKFPKGITVAEFIKTVIEENPKEWGHFDCGWGTPKIAEYDHGTVKYTEEYERLKNKIVNKATADSGWSYMGYDLSV